MLSQEVGGTDNGIYRIQLAVLEFEDIPSDSGPIASATAAPTTSSRTSAATSTYSKKPPNEPVSSILSSTEHGSATNAVGLGLFRGSAVYVLAFHALRYTRGRGRIL